MQTLAKFKKFVDEITADSSRLYKESVLLKYKDDEDIKYYLNFIYNPYIVTGISDKKMNKDVFGSLGSLSVIGHIENKFTTVKDILEYVCKNNTGKDEVLREIHCFQFNCLEDVEVAKLFYQIITKNLQLGIDAKTVNKIIPGLIPTFNVMLANKYFDKPEVVEGKKFAITTKIDGMRCIMLKENGEVKFFSRQGQPIEGLVDLIEEAKRYFPDGICFDGELIAKETSLEDTYKNTMKTARTKDAVKHNLKLMVFDGMTVDEFKNQKCDTPYYMRRYMIGDLFESASLRKDKELREQGSYLRVCDRFPEYFDLLPIWYEGTDTKEIVEWLDELTGEGEEGIMINIYDAPYEFKRTNKLLKVKKFQDTEVKVTGFEAGINRLSGTLGALICDYKGNTVKVGSGFSDELRKAIWEHQEEWLNKIITVKYFEESHDSKTGQKSLRFLIYMRVREDI